MLFLKSKLVMWISDSSNFSQLQNGQNCYALSEIQTTNVDSRQLKFFGFVKPYYDKRPKNECSVWRVEQKQVWVSIINQFCR